MCLCVHYIVKSVAPAQKRVESLLLKGLVWLGKLSAAVNSPISTSEACILHSQLTRSCYLKSSIAPLSGLSGTMPDLGNLQPS